MITGTHFNYYHICHRKLWLFANSIQMEHTSDIVYEGRQVHENSYLQRPERYQEVEIDGVKIDYFDAKNKVVHEVKKSDKAEGAHEWQVKYYILKLERAGILNVTGILEYPKLRKKTEVYLSGCDRQEIEVIEKEIERIIRSEQCPGLVKQLICKNCSYYDFCYCREIEP